MRTAVLTIHTGREPVVRDITRECAGFVRGAGDGLLNVWVPHATAGLAVVEVGAAATTTCCARSTSCCPRTAGGGTGTGAPGTAGTTCCRRTFRRR